MERNSFVERSIKGVDLNSELIIQVIALAFMNKEADPSEQLLIRIRRDFTSKDVAEVMGVVLKMMNLTSFMTAIISVRSLDVLEVKEMSPTDQRSQIASGEQLEE